MPKSPESDKVKVGDVLLYIPREKYRHERNYTVTKIGRKWITLDGIDVRANVDTLEAEEAGYGHSGRFYRSRAEYDAVTERLAAWSKFRNSVYAATNPPSLANLDTIQQAAAILGLYGAE